MSVLPKFAWPVPSTKRGNDFANRDDVMSHLDGEATGWYMLGSNGMWHGGIHITNATTPWCALSGKAASEVIDFPVPFKGEQAIRCMADGEVVAYRICRDYLDVPWETGPLSLSGSFVLVRHYIQPGEKQESGLHFYTLYMHLAPYSAYDASMKETQWVVNDSLSAYRPEWVMSASTDNKEVSDSYRVATIPKGALVEWDAEDTSLRTTGHNGRRYGLVTFKGLSVEAKNKGKHTTLQEGQQYWILSDKNNLISTSGAAACPSWWVHLQPPFAEPMQFDTVVCPTPYTISAGDSIGHLGYFQSPKDGGYDARYQVHIECLSADDNLPSFLKNPEKVGEKTPLYLKCPPGLALFSKDLNTKAMVSNGRTSQGETILILSQVKTEKDPQKQEYWFLPYANGYVPKSNSTIKKLSQYDLEKLGFTTTVDEAPSFDHLDGKTPPKGLVRGIYDRLFNASSNDTRASHSAVPHNYQRLLNRIDGNISPYSPQEYLSAIHNPSYRDVRNKMIVKHPSEWYHKKGDSIWLPFLNNLTKDAPEWKTYSEAFIDKMVWMQDATKLKLGPSLWHMHPVVFLSSFMENSKSGWAHSPFANLLGSVESKNDYSAYNTTKTGKSVAHYNTKLTSMSLAEVMEAQKVRTMFATGRFQIIPDTLKSAVQSLNLDTASLYNEDTQDEIFNEYLIKVKRPALINYLEGEGSVEDAIYDWAKEFASAGVRLGKKISPKREVIKDEHGRPKLDHGKKMYKIIPRTAKVEGESYYAGDGLNKTHLLPNDMVKVLKKSKDGK
ncbi:TPA: hypothetical protein JG914_004422 [Enterobacter hormaechei subsp. steigerwaltii]|nr:hypothetical protein [Enterobacter hormaechei subsp. steigerwaltii]